MKFSIFPSCIFYYHCYRMFLTRYCATYEKCVFQKIILCMMSFCKKNHLSYLDTQLKVEQKKKTFFKDCKNYILSLIYCHLRGYFFSWKFENICFCWKAWHKFFQNKLEIQKTDRYPLPLLVSVVIIYSWFVSMKHNTQLIWYFIVVVSITCMMAKHKYIVYTIMIYWSIFFFAITRRWT